jgi:cytochrome c553
MNKLILAVVTVTVMMASPVFAGDAAAGKGKSVMCAACHGADGISAIPTYPNLAGQKEAYLVKQLTEFKSGKRDNAIMKGMVMALTPTDMENLAAYYANMK